MTAPVDGGLQDRTTVLPLTVTPRLMGAVVSSADNPFAADRSAPFAVKHDASPLPPKHPASTLAGALELLGEIASVVVSGIGTAVGPLGVVPQAAAATIAPIPMHLSKWPWIDGLTCMCHHLKRGVETVPEVLGDERGWPHQSKTAITIGQIRARRSSICRNRQDAR